MLKRNPTASDKIVITDFLQYDKTTGTLRWKIRPATCVRAGYVAGRRHQNGHIEVRVKGVTYMAHHIIWFLHYGSWPVHTVLHTNGNKQDNRIENLYYQNVGQ